MNIDKPAYEELEKRILQLEKENEGLKALENEFREKEDIFRAIFNNSPVGLEIYDKNAILWLCNKRSCEIFGFRAESVVGKLELVNGLNYQDIIVWENHDNVAQIHHEIQVPFNKVQFKIIKKGTTFYQIVISPIPDNVSDSIGYIMQIIDITESKRVEENLKQAKEIAEETSNLLKNITDNVPAFIAVVDAFTLKYKFINNRYSESFGKTKEEILNHHIVDVIGRQNAEFAMKYIEEVRQGKISSYINTFNIAQGRRYVNINYVPGYNDNGEVKDIIVMGHDITPIKESEQELLLAKETVEESSRLNKILLQTIPFGIDIVNPEGIILYQNKLFTEKFGDKAIGKKCWEVYRDDKTQCKDCPLLKEIEIGNTEICESKGILGGRIFQISHTGMNFHGHNAILEIFQDITERKQNAEILHDRENRLSSIFRVAPTGIGVVKNRVLFEVNPRICEMTGYTKEELIGQSARLLYPSQEDFEYVGKEKYRQISLFGTGIVETQWKKKNGAIIDILLASTPIDTENLSKGVTFTALDFSERKKLELELIKAKELAEESNRLKTAFLQNMSHEIMTPLNAIMGFSGIIDDPDLSPEKRKSYTTIIKNSSAQLLSIVTDILTISSLETKQEKPNIQKVCINSIIVDLLSIFKTQAWHQNVSFYAKQELTDRKSEIYTDNSKITQILSNLLTNALKFTHEGYIEFGYKIVDAGQIVGTGQIAETGHALSLQFYVKDTGIGIEEGLQEIIFERFRQADLSISKSYGGTGLGLSISKGFVELLGGKIWVESVPGKGSTFYFTVPYNPVHEVDNINIHIEQKENVPLILVAEDEEFNYLFIEELLINMDLRLIHAKDGLESVDICKENPNIGLVLMDIKMPGLDGYSAAKQIKVFRPGLPIIAQFAYALENEIKLFSGDAFDDYITKPIDRNEFRQKLMKYIDIQ